MAANHIVGTVLPQVLLSMLLVQLMIGFMCIDVEARKLFIPHDMVTIANKMGSPLTVTCWDGPTDLGLSQITDIKSWDYSLGRDFVCNFHADSVHDTRVILASPLQYCEVCNWTVSPTGFYDYSGWLVQHWNQASVQPSP